MSFDPKISLEQRVEQSPQQKKLNRLIEKIEQQKIQLAIWQKAQAEIQLYSQKTLVPVYHELHIVLFHQLEQLWQHVHEGDFSKGEIQQLDEKLQNLAVYLTGSQALSASQAQMVEKMDTFYQQYVAHNQAKRIKKNDVIETDLKHQDYDELADSEEWSNSDYQQARAQAKLKKQQEKREQAEQMAAQSLKTVYLKIAAMIHPDREKDEAKKEEKTEMFQKVNQAYEQQDLFYLLKMQLQLEQHKDVGNKALSAEQVKFYKLALDVQSQQLESQINEILDSFQLVQNVKAEHLQIGDVYKSIDADCAELKQQVKWEKERLKHMKKVNGVALLLGHGVL